MWKGEVVIMSGLGDRIADIRIKQKMTMEEFGEVVGGATKSNVSKWEKGYNQPNKERLKKIAELGGISVIELLGGDVGMNDNQKIVFEYLKSRFTHPITSIFGLAPDKYPPEKVEAAYTQLNPVEEAFVLIALGNYVIQKARIADGS